MIGKTEVTYELQGWAEVRGGRRAGLLSTFTFEYLAEAREERKIQREEQKKRRQQQGKTAGSCARRFDIYKVTRELVEEDAP